MSQGRGKNAYVDKEASIYEVGWESFKCSTNNTNPEQVHLNVMAHSIEVKKNLGGTVTGVDREEQVNVYFQQDQIFV